ncbi:transglutaminase domain-containing protein [Occultella glacieicola]|uniref:Transglutaminase domain-containing protein n=1 Tax=Occultella glacieicola TaxID=2518684 RepID=A0ABY2E0L9_9MICO|nr:transglutaminase-like domain-containing protein [Occultella glacieicola]TDE91494.1 transglutaminase domain-containing protein [Occultella glacieicola]
MIRFATAAWSALVLALATLPLAAGYSSPVAAGVLIGCAIVPFGIAALGRVARVGRGWVAVAGTVLAVSAALILLDGVEAEAQAQPGWRASPALSLLGPLIDSVPRLLTAPRPAPADVGYLVPTALLVWIVALGVAVVAVGRARATAAPLVGAVALLVAGGLLTAGRGDATGWIALATAVVLLLGWVLLPSQARASSRVGGDADPGGAGGGTRPGLSGGGPDGSTGAARRRVLVPAVAAVILGSFALTAVAVPTSRSFEPRTLVPPPELPLAATNPIPNLALWNARPNFPLLSVSPDGARLPERLTVAALPDFDGAAWTIDARLRAVGVVDEPDLQPGTRQREVAYVLADAALAGVWVPSAGMAAAVSGADVLMDTDTGVLVAPDGLGSDPVSVRALVDAPTDAEIDRAGTPMAEVAARYLELPRIPASLREESVALTEGTHSRWEQALAIAEGVRGERTLDVGAPSGSSYGRIQEFLFLPEADGGQVGTSEQFAASFAVLARAAGLPTRLVIGFDLTEAVAAADGSVTVTGDDARMWAEVYFARAGWVAVDPSPATSIDTGDLPEPPTGEDQPDRPEDVGAEDDQDAEENVAEPGDDADGRTGMSVATGLTLLAGLAFLGVLAVVALAIARAVRRRRWRAAGAVGAWALVLDAAVLAGRPVPRSSAAPEAARALAGAAETGHSAPDRSPVRSVSAAPEDRGTAALMLAERAERAAFGPQPRAAGSTAVGHSAPIGAPTEATSDWELATAVERDLRAGASTWRRAVWWVSPAVLRGRRASGQDDRMRGEKADPVGRRESQGDE